MKEYDLAPQAGKRHRLACLVKPDKVVETLANLITHWRTGCRQRVCKRPPQCRPFNRIENNTIVQGIENTLLPCIGFAALQCTVHRRLFSGFIGLPGPGTPGCYRERPVITSILVENEVFPRLFTDVRYGIRILG